MRIVYTCQDTTVAGGLERIICEKASAMAARGHDVWLLVCNPPGREAAYPVDRRVHVADMAMAPPRGLWQRLRFKTRLSAMMRKALRDAAPDIVVAVPTWLSWAMMAGPWRLVLESHSSRRNLFSNERQSFYKRLKVAAAERRADCVVALTAEESLNWPRAARREVIPNFTSMIMPADTAPRSGRFMAAGRISTEKGLDMLVDAWAIVVRSHPEAMLDIYGEGRKKESIAAQIAEAGLEANISLKGIAADIAEAYATHKSLVLSSHYEGFGLVLIEAMRCGCAVVATDCPYGPREIVRHEATGLLVPFRGLSRQERVQGIADAVCRIIEDPALTDRLAAEARRDSSRYDTDTIMARWEALFASLL